MDIEKFNKMNDLQGKIKGLRRLIDTVQWHISASKTDSDRGRQSEKMANVPASYLMWLYDDNKCNKEVRDYIEDNLDVLKEEIKRNKK